MRTTAKLDWLGQGHPLPSDGEYAGVWGGYKVKFDANGISFSATTRNGIRTIRAKCTVTVIGEEIVVTA